MKPTQTRYYKNLKTGQYCTLEGSPLAIRNIETKQWKLQKVSVKRIPKREWKANVPNAIIGYGYNYNPNFNRKGRSEIRKGKNGSVHDCSFFFWPYLRYED